MQFALIVMLLAFLYLFCSTFVPMTKDGAESSKTINPFMLSTVVGTILYFYFGKKHENQSPEYLSALEKKAMEEAVKAEEERIKVARSLAIDQEKTRLDAAKTSASVVAEDIVNSTEEECEKDQKK
jgi:hypothetical protein